jgi:hypothetical protein
MSVIQAVEVIEESPNFVRYGAYAAYTLCTRGISRSQDQFFGRGRKAPLRRHLGDGWKKKGALLEQGLHERFNPNQPGEAMNHKGAALPMAIATVAVTTDPSQASDAIEIRKISRSKAQADFPEPYKKGLALEKVDRGVVPWHYSNQAECSVG